MKKYNNVINKKRWFALSGLLATLAALPVVLTAAQMG